MPFDPVNFKRIATRDEFWAGTHRQKLEYLAYALRHIDPSHHWDFSEAGGRLGPGSIVEWLFERPMPNAHKCKSAGCAIGWARALWADKTGWFGADHLTNSEPELVGIFGMSGSLAHLKYRGAPEVTPEMVADQLDLYLSKTKG